MNRLIAFGRTTVDWLWRCVREYLVPFAVGFVLGEVPQAANQEPPACCAVVQVDGGRT